MKKLIAGCLTLAVVVSIILYMLIFLNSPVKQIDVSSGDNQNFMAQKGNISEGKIDNEANAEKSDIEEIAEEKFISKLQESSGQINVTMPESEKEETEESSNGSIVTNKITTALKITNMPVTTSEATTITGFATTTNVPATTTTVEATTKKVETTVTQTENKNETFSVTYNGAKYTGDAYDIILKVVTAEVPTWFDDEAIKAQAIATYTYIKYCNLNGMSPVVSMKTLIPDKIKNNVDAIYGQAVYYNGTIAQTVYCASSGGFTASAKDVWGNNIPYLVSVESEYDKYDSNYGVTKVFSEAEMRKYLETAGYNLSDNPENWIQLLPAEDGGIFDGGYVGKILIDGKNTYNGKLLTGRILRENILEFSIKSSKFTVVYKNGEFVFVTYGYGHGVGMPQNGVNLYAVKGGYTYKEILEHYYKGVTVK